MGLLNPCICRNQTPLSLLRYWFFKASRYAIYYTQGLIAYRVPLPNTSSLNCEGFLLDPFGAPKSYKLDLNHHHFKVSGQPSWHELRQVSYHYDKVLCVIRAITSTYQSLSLVNILLNKRMYETSIYKYLTI
jgi:hypothetical protein